jgi:hypothetical protein
MTDQEATESCHVCLLVPHPGRTAILVAETRTPPGHLRMPTLRLPGAEPLLPDILASVDVVDTGETAVLRQVMTSSSGAENGEPGENGEVSLIAG